MGTGRTLPFAFGLVMLGASTACGPPSDTTLDVQVHGAGRVVSDDGRIDCSSDGTGSECSVSIGTTTSFHLQAIPGSGGTFVGWSYADAADCTACGGDPPVGAIAETGPNATVTIDYNEGYQDNVTVAATFSP